MTLREAWAVCTAVCVGEGCPSCWLPPPQPRGSPGPPGKGAREASPEEDWAAAPTVTAPKRHTVAPSPLPGPHRRPHVPAPGPSQSTPAALEPGWEEARAWRSVRPVRASNPCGSSLVPTHLVDLCPFLRNSLKGHGDSSTVTGDPPWWGHSDHMPSVSTVCWASS